MRVLSCVSMDEYAQNAAYVTDMVVDWASMRAVVGFHDSSMKLWSLNSGEF